MFVKTQIKNEFEQAFFKNSFIPESNLKKQFLSSLFIFLF